MNVLSRGMPGERQKRFVNQVAPAMNIRYVVSNYDDLVHRVKVTGWGHILVRKMIASTC